MPANPLTIIPLFILDKTKSFNNIKSFIREKGHNEDITLKFAND